MELLILACSSTLQEKIEYMFEDIELSNYTHIPQVTGSGEGGGTRLNNEVWPGQNLMYIIHADQTKLAQIKSWVKTYRNQELREGIKLFAVPLVEVI